MTNSNTSAPSVKPIAWSTPANGPLSSFRAWQLLVPVFLIVFSASVKAADGSSLEAGVLTVLLRWTPLLLKGFGFNILISLVTVILGTFLGVMTGLALVSIRWPLRWVAAIVTEFFRNAPWLVLLFFVTFLLPFQMKIGDVFIFLPGWVKAVIGLTLPVMANVAEIMRGAIRSIPSTQWQTAESLGFSRLQQLWLIILPQCMKRMLPPWMNLYAILTMSTTLASIVGVNEVVTLAGEVQAAEGGRPALLMPIYSYVMLMFFLYSYPIAVFTQRLEKRFGVELKSR